MRIALAYKNFAANRNLSHIGLGVAAMNNCKVLEEAGIHCEIWPIYHPSDLMQRLDATANDGLTPVTHVIVSAPWIPITDWSAILMKYHRIHFTVNIHSNVGFLQADASGVDNLDGCMGLETGYPNFHLAGNSKAFITWIRDAYANPCLYLPNMYWLSGMTREHRPGFSFGPGGGGVLRIGCFGAVRPLKNSMSAGAAAVEIASRLRCDLEFWVSGGRLEGGGDTVMRALTQMFKPIKFATIKTANWESWPTFRKTVANMHLLMQPSYTESFNMVTADGIAEGVPSVVSEAIEWVPDYWKADNDDVGEIARVGRNLLFDRAAVGEGRECLANYVDDGLRSWKKYLNTRKV